MSKHALNILAFVILLFGSAYLQTSLKLKPQLIMLGLGIVVLLSHSFASRIFSLFFGLLLALLLYINFFLLYLFCSRITGKIGPMIEISSMIFSVIITVPALFFYFWKFKRKPKLEKICTMGFLVLTSVVFVIYEANIFK